VADAAFLAAICEDPADDTPRLVYADWLEEHGDTARAEYIRLQIQRARGAEDDPRRPAWWRRETELIRKHGTKWMRDIPPEVRRYCVFRRGFIGRIQCTPRQLLKASKRLERTVPLEDLRLTYVRSDLREVLALPCLARLTALDLSSNGLGPDAARVLAACRPLAGLRWLNLAHNRIGRDGARALAHTSHEPPLDTLILQSNYIGDSGVKTLAGAGRLLGRLITLNLRYNFLGPAGARALARCSHLAGLTALYLSGNPLGDLGVAALARSPIPARLQELDLSRTQVGDVGARALAVTANLQHLKSLNLSGNRRISDGVRQSVEQRFGTA
jgi:uncharacterized protein (TIGR02996 family)